MRPSAALLHTGLRAEWGGAGSLFVESTLGSGAVPGFLRSGGAAETGRAACGAGRPRRLCQHCRSFADLLGGRHVRGSRSPPIRGNPP